MPEGSEAAHQVSLDSAATGTVYDLLGALPKLGIGLELISAEPSPDLLELPRCDLAMGSRTFAFTCQAQQAAISPSDRAQRKDMNSEIEKSDMQKDRNIV